MEETPNFIKLYQTQRELTFFQNKTQTMKIKEKKKDLTPFTYMSNLIQLIFLHNLHALYSLQKSHTLIRECYRF